MLTVFTSLFRNSANSTPILISETPALEGYTLVTNDDVYLRETLSQVTLGSKASFMYYVHTVITKINILTKAKCFRHGQK